MGWLQRWQRRSRVRDLLDMPALTDAERQCIEDWIAGRADNLFFRCQHITTAAPNAGWQGASQDT